MNLKIDNVDAIEKEREGLKVKIVAEMEAKARGDANKEHATETERD